MINNKFYLKISLLLVLLMFCIPGCSKPVQPTRVEIAEEPEELEDEVLKPVQSEENVNPSEQLDKNMVSEEETNEEVSEDGSDEEKEETEDSSKTVDLIMFMGQSNMSGVGGNPDLAPKVPEGYGYEFKAIADPTKLYNIEEPFGVYESFIGGICDFPGSKKGSLVSAFVNEYYEETGVPCVCVSASEGATTTEKWMSAPYQADLLERYNRAVTWLESNGYTIRNRFALWLQGESDAANNVSGAKYIENMDNIIRGLFINGLQKVFIITPGRTISIKSYFDSIIESQISMCKNSGYYALATTVLCGLNASNMTDEWHYNQYVLNLVGRESAKSMAYYVNNNKEMCLYNYKTNDVYIPDGYEYSDDEEVEILDISGTIGQNEAE